MFGRVEGGAAACVFVLVLIVLLFGVSDTAEVRRVFGGWDYGE